MLPGVEDLDAFWREELLGDQEVDDLGAKELFQRLERAVAPGNTSPARPRSTPVDSSGAPLASARRKSPGGCGWSSHGAAGACAGAIAAGAAGVWVIAFRLPPFLKDPWKPLGCCSWSEVATGRQPRRPRRACSPATAGFRFGTWQRFTLP